MSQPLPCPVSLQAFDVVERSFLESIDDALAEKASLQSQLPEVITCVSQYCWGPDLPPMGTTGPAVGIMKQHPCGEAGVAVGVSR